MKHSTPCCPENAPCHFAALFVSVLVQVQLALSAAAVCTCTKMYSKLSFIDTIWFILVSLYSFYVHFYLWHVVDIKWLSGHSWHLTVLRYISRMLIFVSMHSVCHMRLSYFSQLRWNSRSSRGELHLRLRISGICAEQNNAKHWDQMFHLASIAGVPKIGAAPICVTEANSGGGSGMGTAAVPKQSRSVWEPAWPEALGLPELVLQAAALFAAKAF